MAGMRTTSPAIFLHNAHSDAPSLIPLYALEYGVLKLGVICNTIGGGRGSSARGPHERTAGAGSERNRVARKRKASSQRGNPRQTAGSGMGAARAQPRTAEA